MTDLVKALAENQDHFCVQFWRVAKLGGYQECDDDAIFLHAVFMRSVLLSHRDIGIRIDEAALRTSEESLVGKGYRKIDYLLGAAWGFYRLSKKGSADDFRLPGITTAWRALGAAEAHLDEQFLDTAIVAPMIQSMLARKAADARHSETNKLKDEVIAYWSKHISPKLSNEKAASLLVKQFPLAHRTLRDYVAGAKRAK